MSFSTVGPEGYLAQPRVTQPRYFGSRGVRSGLSRVGTELPGVEVEELQVQGLRAEARGVAEDAVPLPRKQTRLRGAEFDATRVLHAGLLR